MNKVASLTGGRGKRDRRELNLSLAHLSHLEMKPVVQMICFLGSKQVPTGEHYSRHATCISHGVFPPWGFLPTQ